MAQEYRIGDIARLLNLTDRRVQQLVSSGHIPRAERGVYNPVACVHGYIAYLKKQIEVARGGGESEGILRQRYMKVKAELSELQLARERGDLIPRDLIYEVWGKKIITFKTRILGIPIKAASKILGVTTMAEINAILTHEIYEVLNELSDPIGGISRENDSPAAPADGERMGGPKKDALARGQRRTRPVADGPGGVPAGDDERVE